VRNSKAKVVARYTKSLLGVEDLARMRFGHAEDVLQLSEVLQLRFLLRGEPILFGQIQQFQSAMLSCGRWLEIDNRLRCRARGKEVDDF